MSALDKTRHEAAIKQFLEASSELSRHKHGLGRWSEPLDFDSNVV
ncbi:hypothetical protein [Paenibacillus alkaliterrae]|nr:hypothetical protein [Paenibacillus alkaliterrae]